MRTGPVVVTALAAALLGSGCDRVPAEAVTRCEDRIVRAGAQTDVLFVIDDSGSMSEEQQNVRDGLADFIDRLASGPVENVFRIGVTNTSVDDFDRSVAAYGEGPNETADPAATRDRPFPAGALLAVDPATPGRYLYDPAGADGNPLAGFTGNRILQAGAPGLVDDFKANVLVGTSGSGKEQAFRAARLALSDRLADGVNAGFLRRGARLAIVFVSDEDDCSDSEGVVPAENGNAFCHSDAGKEAIDGVEAFASFLRGPIGGERKEVVVATIAGVNPQTRAPSCADADLCADRTCGTAYDGADRFVALAEALGATRTRLDSICQSTFAGTLADVAALLVPQSVTLEGAPADWRMLSVGVVRAADGARVACTVAPEGSEGEAGADAVYTPPAEGQPPRLTFQGACSLTQGDMVDLKLVCAG